MVFQAPIFAPRGSEHTRIAVAVVSQELPPDSHAGIGTYGFHHGWQLDSNSRVSQNNSASLSRAPLHSRETSPGPNRLPCMSKITGTLGELTEDLLQLHDRGVGPDALHRLGLLGSLLILKHLLVLVGRLIGRHFDVDWGRDQVSMARERLPEEDSGFKAMTDNWRGVGDLSRPLRWGPNAVC